MGDNETGQVSAAAAIIYENQYLPALFEEWCPLVVEAAQIQNGQHVIDVACGTGVLAIAAADRVGPEGTVAGIDINDGMLNLARLKSSRVDWHNAPAEALPFGDNKFNCAVSQFGLMYFDNQEAGLREMMRVLQPGGSLVVVVWDKPDNNPGFAAEEQLWQKTFGDAWADDTPFNLGSKKALQNLFNRSGITELEITTHQGTGRFDSIESWIHTGAKGWTEDDAISDEQLEGLLQTAEKDLADFKTAEGAVAFPTSAHIVSARKLGK